MTWARYTVLVSSSFNSQQPVKPSQGSVTTTSLPVLSYRIASVQESSLPPQQRMSISNPSENFAVLLSEEPSPCASAPRRYFLMRSAYGLLTYIVSSRTVFFGSTSTRIIFYFFHHCVLIKSVKKQILLLFDCVWIHIIASNLGAR